MELAEIAGVTAACLLSVVILFQLALAVGAPWGFAAYGGRVAMEDGRLPNRYRMTSLASAIVLALALSLILMAADLIDRGPVPAAVPPIATWILAGLFVLNTLANLKGRHALERIGASAITAALAVACIVIVVSG